MFQKRTLPILNALFVILVITFLGATTPAEAQKVHAFLIVMDNDAVHLFNVGVRQNLWNVQEMLAPVNANLEVWQAGQRSFQAADITRQVQNLEVQQGDTVLVYYSGHGYMRDDEHYLALDLLRPSASLLRSELAKAVSEKNCGLKILITDTCSNYIKTEGPIEESAVIIPRGNVLTDLLYKHEGFLDMTAAAPGQYAFGNAAVGGYFTNSLTTSTNPESDINQDGFVSWEEVFTVAQQKTENYYSDSQTAFSVADRRRIEEAGQTTQSPVRRSLPTPITGDITSPSEPTPLEPPNIQTTAKAQKVHAFLIIMDNDPEDNPQSEFNISVKQNRWNVQGMLSSVNASLEVWQARLRSFQAADVLQQVQNIEVQQEDTFLVYYSGHGYRRNGKHYLNFDRQDLTFYLLRSELAKAVSEKNCRLKMLITDTCNNYIKRVGGAYESAEGVLIKENVLTDLFFKHEGFLDITAAASGQYAFGSTLRGGYFTNSLTTSTNPESDINRDGFISWEEVFTVTQQKTKNYYSDTIFVGAARRQVEESGQTTQTPVQHSLPTPITGNITSPGELPPAEDERRAQEEERRETERRMIENSRELTLMGKAKFDQKRYGDAVTDFDRAIRIYPENAEAYYWRGRAYMEIRFYSNALQDLQTALQLAEKVGDTKLKADVESVIESARELEAEENRRIQELERRATEEKIIEASLEITLTGKTKYNQKQYSAAITDFDQAIHIYPENAEAYYWRGTAKMKLGIFSEALKDLQTALQLAKKAGDTKLETDAMALLENMQRAAQSDTSGMALIPPGPFRMGADKLVSNQSKPIHVVELDAFWIDTHEVTVGEYKQFLKESKYNMSLRSELSEYAPTDDHPVVGVSWHDAMAYAQWVGKRLPTEAEWEKAARGGLMDGRFPWGNDDIDSSKANYGNINGRTVPVGSYPPNAYELYDMVGNVMEWCMDPWDSNFYARSPIKNPFAGNKDIEETIADYKNVRGLRVARGGSWHQKLPIVGGRFKYDSMKRTLMNVGFRCVRDVAR